MFTFVFLSGVVVSGEALPTVSRLLVSLANTLLVPPEVVRFLSVVAPLTPFDDVCTAAISVWSPDIGATLLCLLALRLAVVGVVVLVSVLDLTIGDALFLLSRSLIRIEVVRSGGVGTLLSVVVLLRLKRIDAGIVCLP